jgi:excisionase family DNA binding protein
MSAAAQHSPQSASADDTRIAAVEANVERLTAITFVLSSRLTELEHRSGAANTDDAATRMTTIKDAAHMTGYSESGIRKLIAARKIVARRVGGRWLIEVASLPRRCE